MARARTVCLECANLARPGSNRCAHHEQRYRQAIDQQRPTSHQRGYGHQWRRTRDAYLHANPRCTWPGCFEQATDVHHIDGQGPRGVRGLDWSNLRSFCGPHHARLTTHAQPGGWHRRPTG